MYDLLIICYTTASVWGLKSFFLHLRHMRKERYRRLIALLFLLAFTGAIGKNISCDIGHLPIFSHHEEEHDHGHSHSSGQHHHHSHEHTGPEAAHEHDGHEHDSETSKDDGNCCKNLAKTLYSGLSKPVNAKLQFQKECIEITTVYIESLQNVVFSFKAADYYSWKAPPPKIPDIRVFIHSFII
jgi:hypothetical protein